MERKGSRIRGYDLTFLEDESYDPYGDDGRCWGCEYGCFDDEESEI